MIKKLQQYKCLNCSATKELSFYEDGMVKKVITIDDEIKCKRHDWKLLKERKKE